MSAPDPRDPSQPQPAPDATQRLPVGEPVDPRSTVQVDIPRLLSSQAIKQAPRPEPVTDPSQTLRLKGEEPPIRVQKVDRPQETEGQTLKPTFKPAAARRFPWKLQLGFIALGILGVAAFFVFSRGTSPAPVTPYLVEDTASKAEAAPPAAEVYLQQAKSGDAHAMRMLGVMYFYGLNVPRDREKGLYWYRRAAEKGSDAARSELNKIEGGR